MINTRKTCRICGSPLISVLDLGSLELINYFKSPRLTRKVPLELVKCDMNYENACGLTQLRHTVHPSLLYEEYFYRSSGNATMRDHLRSLVKKAIEVANPKNNDIIVDIGCNDGFALNCLKKLGYNNLIGFDPARNLDFPNDLKDCLIQDYFNFGSFTKKTKNQSSLIISIAMFYDLEDPNEFVRQIKLVLDRKGVWVLELSYLPLMLSQNSFDTICHEHLCYYSLIVLEKLLLSNLLEIIDVYTNDVNGGSFQVYVAHKGQKKISNDAFKRIQKLRRDEFEMEIDTPRPYCAFKDRISDNCNKLINILKECKNKGQTVWAYGASTKGVTTLQVCRITSDLVHACADSNSIKWGTYITGTDIPIVSEDDMRKSNPDYLLILPWHFVSGFIEREKEYLQNGGKFIVPMPEPRVISNV